MPKKRARPIITEDELRDVIASVAMECGPFTAGEIEALRRVQRGEITVEQSIHELRAEIVLQYQAHPEKFLGPPDFLQENPKKRWKNCGRPALA